MNKKPDRLSQELAKLFTVGSFSAIGCFVAQRVLTWKSLGLETMPSSAMRMQAQVTGLLADIWGGVVVASIILCVTLLVPLFRRNSFIFYPVLMMLAIFFLCLHVPYVEYFGSMISLSHFKYLFDFDFLKAGSANVFDRRLWAIEVFCFAAMPIGLFFIRKYRRPGILAISVFVFGALSQVAKVQLNTKKVGWKTPKILSVTSIEYVFVQLMESGDLTPEATSDAELLMLKSYAKSKQFSLKSILESDLLGAQSALGQALKNTVEQRLKQHLPVTLFVALLESVRPEESRFFTPANPISYTPFIDELAAKSVAYTNAYTSGGVTRSGQEATLCGLQTGEYTSAMRNLLSLNPTCLPQLLKNKLGPKAWSAWWHAGDYNFDSQGTFWQRHGVEYTTSRSDFSTNAPHNFWGVSDFTLVEKLRLEILKRMPPETLLSSQMFLSITNHPDWGLPTDTPAEIDRQKNTAPHISLVTTRYTDEAVKRLVDVLRTTPCLACKDESLWDSSVFVLINDHGNLSPSQAEPNGYTFGISSVRDIAAANVVSRGALVVSGGLVQKELLKLKIPSLVETRAVSQVDIFATFADLIDEKASTVGDSLFATHRRWPIVVDLGNLVYFPELQAEAKIFSRQTLLKSSDSNKKDTDFTLSKSFFRAYQSLLMSGEAGR